MKSDFKKLRLLGWVKIFRIDLESRLAASHGGAFRRERGL